MKSLPGLLLMLSCLVALILANSPLQNSYNQIISATLSIAINDLTISLSLLKLINDGLMALFFLLIGLELKRELLEGHLSKLSYIILPGVAALGGVIIPALIFIFFNYSHPDNLPGWGIPVATDIAFALGVLSLLGSRVPSSLRIFLLTLAIFDDLVAIIIIALFYTNKLSMLSMILSLAAISILIILGKLKVKKIEIYLFFGALLWIFVLHSGVHATLAGVILGFCIPLSPLKKLEIQLYPLVMYCILPIFALANTGVDLSGLSFSYFNDPLLLGITLGLFLGKQLGIFSFSYLLIQSKWATLPIHATWRQLYGVSVLCGIGFTMSLFINTLAFTNIKETSRLAILLGSLLSSVVGYAILRKQPPHYLQTSKIS